MTVVYVCCKDDEENTPIFITSDTTLIKDIERRQSIRFAILKKAIYRYGAWGDSLKTKRIRERLNKKGFMYWSFRCIKHVDSENIDSFILNEVE